MLVIYTSIGKLENHEAEKNCVCLMFAKYVFTA